MIRSDSSACLEAAGIQAPRYLPPPQVEPGAGRTASAQASYQRLPHDPPSPRSLTEFAIEIPPAPPVPPPPVLQHAWLDRLEQLMPLASVQRPHRTEAESVSRAVRQALSEQGSPPDERIAGIFNALGSLRMPRWCLDEMVSTLDAWPTRVVIGPVPDKAQAAAAAKRQLMALLTPPSLAPQDLAGLLPWLRHDPTQPPSLVLARQVLADRVSPLAPGPALDALLAPLADRQSEAKAWTSIAECILRARRGPFAEITQPLVRALLARAGEGAPADGAIDDALGVVAAHLDRASTAGPGAQAAGKTLLETHRMLLRHLRQQSLSDPQASTQWASQWLSWVSTIEGTQGAALLAGTIEALVAIAGPAPQSSRLGAWTVDEPAAMSRNAPARERLIAAVVAALHPGRDAASLAAACEQVEALAPRLFPGAVECLVGQLRDACAPQRHDVFAKPTQGSPGHEQRLMATVLRLAGPLSLEQFAAAVRGFASADRRSFESGSLASLGAWALQVNDWSDIADPDDEPEYIPIPDAQFFVSYYTALTEHLKSSPSVTIPPAHLGAMSFALEHAMLTRQSPYGGGPTVHHMGALLAASGGLRASQLEAMAAGLLAAHAGLLHRHLGPERRLDPATLQACVKTALSAQPGARDADGRPATQAFQQALQRLLHPATRLPASSAKDTKGAPPLAGTPGDGLRDLLCLLPVRMNAQTPQQRHTALREIDAQGAWPREDRDAMLLALARDRHLPTTPQAFRALHRAALRVYRDPGEKTAAPAARETKRGPGKALGEAHDESDERQVTDVIAVDSVVLMQLYDGMDRAMGISQARVRPMSADAPAPSDEQCAQWTRSLQIVEDAIADVRHRFDHEQPAMGLALVSRLEGMAGALRSALPDAQVLPPACPPLPPPRPADRTEPGTGREDTQ